MGKQRYRHKNTGQEGFIEGETLTLLPSQNATVRFNPVIWDGEVEKFSNLLEDVQMSDLIPVKRPGDNAP